jgi:hypothetical protein
VSAALIAVVLLGTAVTPAASTNTPHADHTPMVGRAYEGDATVGVPAGEPLFLVRQVWEEKSGESQLTVTNLDATGRELQRQTVAFRLGVPVAYAMNNPTAGQDAKATVSGDDLQLEFRDGGETKSARKPRPAVVAMGPSIGSLIGEHLGELKAHRAVPFGMAVPARLDVFELKLVTIDDDDPGRRGPDGRPLMKVALQPTSVLGKLFAPKMEAFVDPDSGRMVKFRGPLPKPNGDLMKVGTVLYDLAPRP